MMLCVIPSSLCQIQKKGVDSLEGYSEIYIRLPVSMKAWLVEFAARVDSNQKQVVIDALEEYREKHDPQELRPRGK